MRTRDLPVFPLSADPVRPGVSPDVEATRLSIDPVGPEDGPRVGLVTLGCDKNTVDSERIMAALVGQGARVSSRVEDADVVVVNTCGFIAAAKEESVDTILEACALKEEGGVRAVVAVGCLVQRYQAELEAEIPEVDLFLGLTDLSRLVPELRSRGLIPDEDEAVPVMERPLRILSTETPHTSFLKISEGCDHTCAFCAIPLMRGLHRSQPVEELVREAQALSRQGVRELNVISQDTTWYGRDLRRKDRSAPLLPDLLRALVRETDVPWYRLFYMYPSGITPELVELMAEHAGAPEGVGPAGGHGVAPGLAGPAGGHGASPELMGPGGGHGVSPELMGPGGEHGAAPGLAERASGQGAASRSDNGRRARAGSRPGRDALPVAAPTRPRILPYLDMPLQHGSDRILEAMRRPERRDTILERVGWLRDAIPDLTLRTTVIVGFPGETDDDFRALLDLLEEIRFERVGAFTYSVEEGTRAAEMEDHVPEGLKKERLEELMDLQRTISLDRNLEQVGRRVWALVDHLVESDDGGPVAPAGGVPAAVARTEGQALDVDGVTHLRPHEGLEPGAMVRVEIVEALDYDLVGEVVE